MENSKPSFHLDEWHPLSKHSIFLELWLHGHVHNPIWHAPKFLVRPEMGPTMLKSKSSWNLVLLLISSTKGGWEGLMKALGLDYKEGQLFSYSVLHQTNHKLVSSPLETLLVLGQAKGNTDLLDSLDSPRPRLEGSHHLPPYSILCVAPLHPHPNGFYSRDSQGGVPKLSRFGLPGLWELITPSSDLGLGRGLKQTCISPWELFNGVLHSTYTHWDWVESWLFMVGSQIVNLTPDLSFDHNLCC
jgi:hypothetical protein